MVSGVNTGSQRSVAAAGVGVEGGGAAVELVVEVEVVVAVAAAADDVVAVVAVRDGSKSQDTVLMSSSFCTLSQRFSWLNSTAAFSINRTQTGRWLDAAGSSSIRQENPVVGSHTLTTFPPGVEAEGLEELSPRGEGGAGDGDRSGVVAPPVAEEEEEVAIEEEEAVAEAVVMSTTHARDSKLSLPRQT